MPSKKRKYNARFPAGRIKKIMQTDEEVGKVAQAVPIIISRTLELFVESLLSKAMQVTLSRNAKTLSPSHVKQCILAESRFDFLRDLVKNIPDVSAAEEKEMVSAESSPNSSRFSDVSVPPRRIVREDSNSSSSCDVKPLAIRDVKPIRDNSKPPFEVEVNKPPIIETIPVSAIASGIIDLSKKSDETSRPIITANFYQETLPADDVQHKSVIKLNPTYTNAQPSTSSYPTVTPIKPINREEIPVPKPDHKPFYVDVTQPAPVKPVTPVLNIDFSKNLSNPVIKVLDSAIASVPKDAKKCHRQNSKIKETRKETKPSSTMVLDINQLNSGNLQIDEDYDT